MQLIKSKAHDLNASIINWRRCPMFVRRESFSQFLKMYPIISIIIFIHLCLFLVTIVPFFPQNWVYQHLSGINLFIAGGEYWRLFTPIFVHTGFAHVLFNSFSLVLFGPYLERLLGKFIFLIVYIGSGVFANLVTFIIMPLTYMHVGASGAIFGLFGVYLALIVHFKRLFPAQGKQVVMPIIAIGVIMTFLQPGVNITAHLAGLLGGFIICTILIKIKVISLR